MRRLGLFLGPFLSLALYFFILPRAIVDPSTGALLSGLSDPGRAVAAIAALMATVVTEVIPIPATSLLPLALFPLFTHGAISISAASAPYAEPTIFLFMGGFMLALALERSNLHRRLALAIISFFGTKPDRLILGFIFATAFISLWVNNTSTVVMMLPVALSVIELLRREFTDARLFSSTEETRARTRNFAICMLLGIGYASSIGGFGTPVGTAPNMLLLGYLNKTHNISIPFYQWILLALPLSILLNLACWLILTRLCFPTRLPPLANEQTLISRQRDELGPWSPAQVRMAVIFVITAAAWIARPWLQQLPAPSFLTTADSPALPLAGLSDAGIAILSALACFLIPSGAAVGARLLSWHHMRELPWGVLLLFGGGLSLASAMESTGVGSAIGQLVASMKGVHPIVLVTVACALLVFIGEFTSNTAATAAMLPVLNSVALGLDIPIPLLLVPAAIACSCGFMMPAGTPPNAIIFATGEIRIADMVKAGLILDLVAVLLVGVLGYLLTNLVLFHS